MHKPVQTLTLRVSTVTGTALQVDATFCFVLTCAANGLCPSTAFIVIQVVLESLQRQNGQETYGILMLSTDPFESGVHAMIAVPFAMLLFGSGTRGAIRMMNKCIMHADEDAHGVRPDSLSLEDSTGIDSLPKVRSLTWATSP